MAGTKPGTKPGFKAAAGVPPPTMGTWPAPPVHAVHVVHTLIHTH